MNAEEYIQQQ